jgi:predicted transcriptional regulator
MSESETITVRLASATKDRLGQLAAQTNRTKSYLAAEAIATYVDREMEIVSGIERGLADMKTGRVVSHVDAMEQLRQTVAMAAKAKS